MKYGNLEQNKQQYNYGKFIHGSLIRHAILVILSSAGGLFVNFVVQFVDILFLSQLEDESIIAATGFSGSFLFFLFPLSVGLSAAGSTISGHLIGAGEIDRFKRFASNIIWFSIAVQIVTIIIGLIIQIPFYKMLGAEKHTLDDAISYGTIMLFFILCANVNMILCSIRNSASDIKGVILINILQATLNGILDPIFIFYFKMGIDGAAWASLIAGLTTVSINFYQIKYKLNILVFTRRLELWWIDIKSSFSYLFPTTLTMLGPTLSSIIGTRIAANHGDMVVSANAIISRVIPILFGTIVFSIGGAISPIISQNYGAKKFNRIYSIIHISIIVVLCYVLIIWVILLLGGTDILCLQFKQSGLAELMFKQYFNYLSPLWITLGISFIINGAFISLGYPLLATLFNSLRILAFTLPMAYFFDLVVSKYYVFAGYMAPLYAHVSGGLVNAIIAYPFMLYILKKKLKVKT